jgi:3-hydroxymyristoyl/3-hydroxydecanoyl-(acyl carrier protein) dehydratase
MPGVLIIEAMAQVGGVLAFKSMGQSARPVVYLTGVDGAKFRKPVVPGDQLRFEVDVVKKRPPFWKMQAKAFVDNELVCEAEVTAMVTEEKSG